MPKFKYEIDPWIEKTTGGGRQDKDGKRKFFEGHRKDLEPCSDINQAFKNLHGSKARD